MNSNEKVEKMVKSFGEFIEAYKNTKLTTSMDTEITSLISNIDKVKSMMSKSLVDDVKISDVEYLMQDIFDNITYTTSVDEYEDKDDIEFLYKIDEYFDKHRNSNVVNIKFKTDDYSKQTLMDKLFIYDFKKRIKDVYFHKFYEYEADGEYIFSAQLWR
jgi:hypothetical protein